MGEMSREERLQLLKDDISEYMGRIADLWKIPVRVTLIVRDPSGKNDMASMVMSDDDLEAAARTLESLRTKGISLGTGGFRPKDSRRVH